MSSEISLIITVLSAIHFVNSTCTTRTIQRFLYSALYTGVLGVGKFVIYTDMAFFLISPNACSEDKVNILVMISERV